MKLDLRPLVVRNDSNGVSLAEAHRDRIHAMFEELRASESVEVLLVKSPPFNPTVWVAVEAWLPADSHSVTRRMRLEIEIYPQDFCRWPVEYDVTLRELSGTRTWHSVVDFSQENAAALLRYMLGQTSERRFGFKQVRAARSRPASARVDAEGYPGAGGARFRHALLAPYLLWRPRNRPPMLKPDVIGRLPWVLIALVVLLGMLDTARFTSWGAYFGARLLTVIVVIAAATFLLRVDLRRAWSHLSGGRAAQAFGPAKAQTTAEDALAARDLRGALALLLIGVLALLVPGGPWRIAILGGLALLILVLQGLRHRLVWSGGRPAAEPRHLTRMDSWQALVNGLGPQCEAVHKEVVKELASHATAGWRVADERIWHWAADGIEERTQTVVAFRSAIAFLHINVYENDLYVGWDAHINRGTWSEKVVGRGVSAESGALCEVRTIAAAQRTANEYDVSDANCVIERVHAIVTRVLRRTLAEHKVDQEIDFTIVRERRGGLTEPDSQQRRPLLSALGLRRKA